MGYNGHIFCFEPIRATCDAISRLAGEDPSWRVFNFALGNENTAQAKRYLPAEWLYYAKFFFAAEHRDQGPDWKSRVCQSRVCRDKAPRRCSGRSYSGPISGSRLFEDGHRGYDLEVSGGCVKWIDKVSLLQSELSITPIYYKMPHYRQALEHYEALRFPYEFVCRKSRSTRKHPRIRLRYGTFGPLRPA